MTIRRMLVLLLALALLAAIGLPAAAEGVIEAAGEAAAGSTLHIASVEDFRRLAGFCALDSYSTGMTVVLDQDLDLGKPTVESAIDTISEKAGEAYEAAKPKVEEVFGAVAEKASAAFEAAKPAVEGAASTVKTKAEELLKRDLDGDGKIGDMIVTDVENPEVGWRTGTNAANDAK